MSDQPTPDTPPKSPSSPPAATVVASAPATEDASELVKLRQERDTLQSITKARETRISELEDENKRLKFPTPPVQAAKKSWMDGIKEFFPDDE